jgi:diguanylate cyclase (GGDEF)-like protein
LLGDGQWPFREPLYQLTLARLLRLRGQPEAAIDELRSALSRCEQAELPPVERLPILDELIVTQEAVGDLAGALRTFREFHDLTLHVRDQKAGQRAQVLNAGMQVERAEHAAQVERLRAERLERDNRKLAEQLHSDALTGLPNRRGLDAAMGRRVAQADGAFACALADIDHFKRINDRYSHLVGDEVLRRVGALMRETVRDGDVAARFGGEEFALVLDRVEFDEARQICERLRTTIAAHPWDEIVAGLTVTISLGLAMRRPGEGSGHLLARADACLYAAKSAGRDRVEVDPG